MFFIEYFLTPKRFSSIAIWLADQHSVLEIKASLCQESFWMGDHQIAKREKRSILLRTITDALVQDVRRIINMVCISLPMVTHPMIELSSPSLILTSISLTLNHLATVQHENIGPFISNIAFYSMILQVTLISKFLLKKCKEFSR